MRAALVRRLRMAALRSHCWRKLRRLATAEGDRRMAAIAYSQLMRLAREAGQVRREARRGGVALPTADEMRAWADQATPNYDQRREVVACSTT